MSAFADGDKEKEGKSIQIPFLSPKLRLFFPKIKLFAATCPKPTRNVAIKTLVLRIRFNGLVRQADNVFLFFFSIMRFHSWPLQEELQHPR